MRKVISTEKLPIKMWLNEIEDGAIEQAKNLANLPFTFKHVALMPDCHQGYGMPIGGVLATKDTIIPNAVGVDIGCGMCSVETNIKVYDIKNELVDIFDVIRELVPVGFKHHSLKQEWEGFNNAPYINIVREQLEKAPYQLGTLGGGNHFIELQSNQDGFLCIMIHSGSRNVGYQIAKYYNKLAQDLCKKWHSNIPEFKGEDGLAFFPSDSSEGKAYIEAMNFALDFALANRTHMMNACKDAIIGIVGDVEFKEMINIHHNYAAIENHFGSNVWVHRKGATSARKGQVGIIPSSQGAKSYIVKGLGNPLSFMSCSHGAGRLMGRKQAIRELDFDAEVKALDDAGIIHSVRTPKQLDEAPSAYKNIDIVMENQKDLVDIIDERTPLGVIKG